jgi:hypothetical protein
MHMLAQAQEKFNLIGAKVREGGKGRNARGNQVMRGSCEPRGAQEKLQPRYGRLHHLL